MRKQALALILIILLAALLVLLTLHNGRYMMLFRDQRVIREWVHNWGAGAPLAIIILQTAQVLLAPIPGHVVGLASGYLFGTAWGTLYSVIGTTVGSLIAFWLTRAYGRPLVEHLVPPKTLAWLDAGAQRRGLFFLVLIFLLPFLPDDTACFIAGLTPIPIPALMLAVLAGRPPGIFVSCWLGAHMAGFSTGQWIALITGSALLAALFLLYGDRLQEGSMHLTEHLLRKWTTRHSSEAGEMDSSTRP